MCVGSLFTFLSAPVFVFILLSVSSGRDKLHCMHVTSLTECGKKKPNCVEIFGVNTENGLTHWIMRKFQHF